MRVGIVGLGYIGFTSACCIASANMQVVGIDNNVKKISLINSGQTPFFEEGLDELFQRVSHENALSASNHIADLSGCDPIIVCVGTPSDATGNHDMSFVVKVCNELVSTLGNDLAGKSVIFRSTFKPGTMNSLIRPIFEDNLPHDVFRKINLIYNPEFLREGSAIYDYHNPSRLVFGLDGGLPKSVQDLYDKIPGTRFCTEYENAEIIKFVDNSWHALKVTFANEIGRLCDAQGLDKKMVYDIFVSDNKLNISKYYLRPGNAFGGSCLPKDTSALLHLFHGFNVHAPVVNSILVSNQHHVDFLVRKICASARNGKDILINGLAFKEGTDDFRDSPNIEVVKKLVSAGYKVSVVDELVDQDLIGTNKAFFEKNLPAETQFISQTAAVRQSYSAVCSFRKKSKSEWLLNQKNIIWVEDFLSSS